MCEDPEPLRPRAKGWRVHLGPMGASLDSKSEGCASKKDRAGLSGPADEEAKRMTEAGIRFHPIK